MDSYLIVYRRIIFCSNIQFRFFFLTLIVMLSSCGKTDYEDELVDIDFFSIEQSFACEKIDILSIDSIIGTKDTAYTSYPSEVTINKLFKLSSISRNYSQGFAIYDKYLFNCHHSNDVIDVFDIETQMPIAYLSLEPDNIIHCNNVNFGSEFFSEDDKFPVLYIQQRGYACTLNAYRIICNGDTIVTAEKVQTIYFESCKLCINAIDTHNNLLYAIYDYKDKDYISCFQMPSVHDGDLSIHPRSAYKTYYTPFTKITQDTAFDDNCLYVLCGYNKEGELWIIDVENKMARVFDLPKYGMTAEPEGIDIYKGSILISFPNRPLYSITFQD